VFQDSAHPGVCLHSELRYADSHFGSFVGLDRTRHTHTVLHGVSEYARPQMDVQSSADNIMIMQALSRHPTAGAKQASQEQLSPERESVTYNQLKLVKALMQHKVNWNEVIVNPPGPVRVAQSTTPSAMAAVPTMSTAQQNLTDTPTGVLADQEEDDVIPF